ncbi:IS21-like element helper ATPase IstB [Halomonas sp. IOP_31]|uniref:IS21-like element helper ATPase IstB n=1 Tax=Halomonas sp. IOP_31 TaxID=2876584 RepID=UPI001E5BC3D7|nr:IS21-like element helper ATPase IstB [Halomonas sp. IOP_31]MCD6010106.1 IS21-like element helper ATPase IstB [Halomonas sp. IOP_31]
MRTITEVLRLKYNAGLSHEKIARACGLSKGVVSKYVSLAQVAGISWPLPETTDDLPFEDRLGMLLDREVLHRENRRLDRLLKAARLRVTACVEDIDYRHPRGLERGRMAPLTSGEWIGQALNLCIIGPTGCGKTWLACALGNQACRQGYAVRYLRVPRLFEQLRIAQGDDSYARLRGQLQKTDLLILDGWGMQKMTAPQRQDRMEVIEDRHGRGSTLIASQLPIEHWHDTIGAATVADAILDRLLHSAHRLTLRGESMRKNTAPQAEAVDPS